MESFYFTEVPQSLKPHTPQIWVSLDFMGQSPMHCDFALHGWCSVWDIKSSSLNLQDLWNRIPANLEKSTCLFRYLWIMFQYR